MILLCKLFGYASVGNIEHKLNVQKNNQSDINFRAAKNNVCPD